jgi:hypothetical protein
MEFAVYVPLDWNVTVPLTVSDCVTVEEGHCVASGLDTPLRHARARFHVPTTLPPHALNVVQSGPALLLVLEHPDAAKQATRANPSHVALMREPSLMT